MSDDDPTSPMPEKGGPLLTAMGSAVLLIREITPDPQARLLLVRKFGDALATVVNSPSGTALTTAAAAAVVCIHEMTPDPKERLVLARKLAATMETVVNKDP